jgi:hypothetical protein
MNKTTEAVRGIYHKETHEQRNTVAPPKAVSTLHSRRINSTKPRSTLHTGQ